MNLNKCRISMYVRRNENTNRLNQNTMVPVYKQKETGYDTSRRYLIEET